MKRPLNTYAGFAQLICGFAVFLLGLWIWWQGFEKKLDSDAGWSSLAIIVGPGVFVALGSVIQATYRKVWPLSLILIGTVTGLWFIVAMGSLFAYVGPTSVLKFVWAHIILLIVTLLVSLWNAIVDLAFRFSNAGVEQIVGRERRKRVS